MRVLIACEYSGIVRDAFLALGHEAMSCDILPTESEGDHYCGDVFDVIDYPWDLMIAHPPCTHLAVSGAAHFAAKKADGRQQAGASFFMKLERAAAHIPKRAIENPVCIMSRLWRKPDQIIQPWQFGHDKSKQICLWTHGLPKLEPTEIIEPSRRACCGKWREGLVCEDCGKPTKPRFANQTPAGQDGTPPGKDRGKLRSEFFTGIASAMAAQWGGDVTA